MAARRLKPQARLLAALGLVLLGHGLAGLWLQQRLAEGWQAVEPMPPPLQVSFTQAMRPTPPVRALPRLRRSPDGAARLAAAPPIDAGPEAVETLEALPALPDVEAPPPPEPGPEWPLSTRLSYTLSGNFRGPVSGFSTVEWLRQGARYQVRIEVAVGPRAAPLISRRLLSEGVLTPQGIAPRRFDEDTRVLIAPRQRRTLLLDEKDGTVTFADGRREPAQRGVQDSSSQFVQLTWLFLTGRQAMQPGQVVEFPLVFPRRQSGWGYRVAGEEVLQTPIGPLSAWHLLPIGRPGPGDLLAEVWLAPTLQYLPVRLLIRESAENFVDLRLDAAPLQEAPIVQVEPPDIQQETPR